MPPMAASISHPGDIPGTLTDRRRTRCPVGVPKSLRIPSSVSPALLYGNTIINPVRDTLMTAMVSTSVVRV